MANIDVTEQLKQRFCQPLSDYAQRRIVIWHDPEGEFAELFASLAGDEGVAFADAGEQFPGGPVRCLELADGNTFASKRLVTREAATENFLLYRRRGRGQLEGDWLADVEHYAEHFQADYVSLLLVDAGIADTFEIRQTVQQCKAFFQAKDRVARFKVLVPNAQTPGQLAMGMFAATLHAGAPTVEAVVRAYLTSLLEQAEEGQMRAEGEQAALPEATAKLQKYGLYDMFASFLGVKLGFKGDLANAAELAAHVLVNAASVTLPEGSLAGLERCLAPSNAQFCLGVFRDWASCGEDACMVLRDAARMVEQNLLLSQRFASIDAASLLETDVFPCINEVILTQYMASLAAGADRGDEIQNAIRTRRDMNFYVEVAAFFDCLGAAMQINDFKHGHAQAFHVADAKQVWQAYESDWWRMDAYYRAFSGAYRQCSLNGNAVLDEPVHELASAIDNLYSNWFLSGVNACWVQAAAESLESKGYVSGVPVQRRFYDDNVDAALKGGAKRVVVIISDALRFEVAQQVAASLDREMRGTSKVESMQATFPSETCFGMAALLPHTKLQYVAQNDEVLADGASTKGTADRQAVLQARRANSLAITFSDLVAKSAAQRKAFAAEAQVIYVYHNVIDAAGHGEKTGQDVFDACADAVNDMVSMVRMAVNNLGASRVIVTADHGFLHTRNDIPESQLVSRDEVQGEISATERRYLRASIDAKSQALVNVNMTDIDGGDFSWWAPRECVRIKASGSRNFVHGGISLQELCVPVLRYRDARAGAKGYEERSEAELKLLSTLRRITTMLFKVDLYQPTAVGGKVVPAEYSLAMTDAAGNVVSDVRSVHADMDSPNEKLRIMQVRFGLKAGQAYKAGDVYYLVCRNKQSGAVAWKQEYQIDIPFAPMDDFGF